MKNKILSNCLQGNYWGSLGEFSNMSYMYGVFWTDFLVELHSLCLYTHVHLYNYVEVNFYFQLIFVFTLSS